jgi:hypothetical protein
MVLSSEGLLQIDFSKRFGANLNYELAKNKIESRGAIDGNISTCKKQHEIV